MTFPLVCYCIAVPRPVVLLLKTLDRIRSFVVAILVYLGACRPNQAAGGRRPAVPIAPSSIKDRLPVVEFERFVVGKIRSSRGRRCCEEEVVCAFCLERLEPKDEVRELGNCCHAFHRECMDRWVDEGEVCCPMCRWELLPNRNMWGGMRMKGPVLKFMSKLVGRHDLEHDN